MEFGGVSVPGRDARNDGAYLLKDLSAFETQLGGLTAFIMVSDTTGAGARSDAGAQLAVNAADTYLGSILRGFAIGQAPVVEPVAMLKAVVAAANTAVMNEAAEAGVPDLGATLVGAFVSADRTWFGQVGGGKAYLLREDEARELVVEGPPVQESVVAAGPAEVAAAPLQVSDEFASEMAAADETQVLERLPEIVPATLPVPAVAAPTVLGREGVRIDVGTADLSAGDVVVLLGRQASEALGDSDIRGITCAACDARVGASDLAAVAAAFEPERSVTIAIWSTDSSPFTPVPEPEADISPVVLAANNDTPGSPRAEKIFLWVMSALIVAEVLALAGMALLSKPSPSASSASTSATAGAESGSEPTPEPAPQPAVVATVTQETTPVAPPAETEKPEYPKKLKVPENVSGGLWLRKKATTLGGDNLVIKLKAGAEVEAVEIEETENASGDKQEFYIFEVSDIDSDQVVETGEYSWPPSKSVKKVYAFAPSFEEVQ